MTDRDRDVRWMTYAGAAATPGVNPESVTKRMRRQGWATRSDNDGKPRVAGPVSDLPTVPHSIPPIIPDSFLAAVPSAGAINPPLSPEVAGLVLALAAQLQSAVGQSERFDAVLLDAVRQAAMAEGEARVLRNSLVGAEARMDRLEAALLDIVIQSTAREARSYALPAEEPKAAKVWRPFWRRWMG